MSQSQSSDTQFVNAFSIVVGSLMLFAIVLFAFARSVGTQQREHLQEEAAVKHAVHHNVEPFAHEAVAGQDNTALAVVAAQPAGGAAAVPAGGEAAFQQVCSACHSSGVMNAPKVGDKAAWGPRIAQGKETLYKDAIEGKGSMPPRGGTTWPDATIKATVDYMVAQVK